jgi:hypothetical protein
MKLPMLLAGLIACLINNVAATALTYKLAANEKACFYATTKKEAEKIAFYFAVRLPSQPASPRYAFANKHKYRFKAAVLSMSITRSGVLGARSS